MRRRKQVFKKLVATTLAIIMSLGAFQMRVNADETEEQIVLEDNVNSENEDLVTEDEVVIIFKSEVGYIWGLEEEKEFIYSCSKGDKVNIYGRRVGYNLSWKSENTGIIYTADEMNQYVAESDDTFHAIWDRNDNLLITYKSPDGGIANYGYGESADTIYYEELENGNMIGYRYPNTAKREGYIFTGWKNEKTGKVFSSDVEAEDSIYYYMPDSDETFFAVWAKACSVTFVSSEGYIFGNEKTKEYVCETIVNENLETIPTIDRPNYTFGGWKNEKNGTVYSVEQLKSFKPNGDEKFIAVIEENRKVTFKSEEGYIYGNPDKKEYIYYLESEYIEEVPFAERPGYALVGWKSDKTGKIYSEQNNNSIYEYVPEANETFYAVWEEAYAISFKSSEGYIYGYADKKEVTYYIVKGNEIEFIPGLERPGYVVVGWESEKTGKKYINREGNYIDNYIPLSDESFKAIWEEAYSIKFISQEGYINGNADEKEEIHEVEKGYQIGYLPRLSRPGYVVIGWKNEKTGKEYSVNWEDENSIYQYTFNSDETFTAIWGKAYILTFISSEGYIEGGADSKEVKLSVEKGKALNDYVSYDRPGYVITGWKSEKNGRIFDYYRNEIYEYVPTSDETFTAIWEEAYTITFKSEEGYFNENPEEKEETYSVEKGKTLNYGPYLKRPGYIVIGWKSEKTGKTYIDSENSIYNYIPESDESFTAIWKEAYTVTYKSEEGYLWNLESETEYSNSIVKGNAINDNGAYVGRNPGKCFVGWLKEGTNELYLDNESHYVSDSERIYNDYGVKKDNEKEKYIWNYVPTSDTTFVAKWTDNVYKMTYDPNGGEIYGADSYVITKGSKIGYDYFDSYYGIKRDGYVLTGYKVKETGELLSERTAESAKQYIEDYIPKSDITLIAQWEKECTITFKSDIEFEDRGSMTSEEKVKECKITNAKGKKMNSIPNIYRPGYVVAGYELEGAGKVFDVLSSGVGENSIWDYVTEKDTTFKVLWKETYTISIKNEGSKLETYDNYIQYYEIPKSYDLSYLDSYYFGYYYPVAKDKKAFAGYRIEGDRSGKVYKCTGDASYDSGEFYKIVPTSDMTFIPAWVDGYYVSVDGDGGWHYAGNKGKYEKYNGKYECYKLDVDKYVIEKNTDLVIGDFYDWGIFDEGAMYKEGCDFVGWTVVGKEDKIYKFGEPIRVDSDMTIKAVWKEKSELNFSDVKDSGKFYYKPVYWAADKGITTGYKGTDTFGVDDSCTRAQFVTFLWRYYGCPEPTTTKNFSDVKEGKFYYKAVMWAAESGITTGYKGTDKFGVDDYCTREQCVTFIYRAANTPKVSETDTKKYGFDDSKKGYYADAVTWAAKNEITNGVNRTTFGVGKLCTRGQLVTFLYRFANTEN